MSCRAEQSSAGSDQAHVFLCHVEWVRNPTLLNQYYALLDPEERIRLSRFRFEQDKRTFLISRALVRCALSLFADVPAGAWRFRKNLHGRPEIDGPTGGPPLRFNLSHTRDIAACVVTFAFDDVGIDIEAEKAMDDVFAIAERFFAPVELTALRAKPIEMQLNAFFSMWTLKESYAKGRGIGLSLPLNRFSFEIERQIIKVHFEAEIPDRPDDWSFTLMQPTPQHWLATAVRVGKSAAPTVIPRWFIPLAGLSQAEPCPVIVAATQKCSCIVDSPKLPHTPCGTVPRLA
jgi:4'-phosphopantetheinyl transferase